MEVLVEYLANNNFRRLNTRLGRPVIITCVPGAGKSSLIRQLLAKDSRFCAVTFGAPDQKNYCGRRICAPGELVEAKDKFLLVDEFTEGDWRSLKPFAIFGDFVQASAAQTLEPDFCKELTHRFGRATCTLLREFGFTVTSEKDDIVQVIDIFAGEPEGQVIAIEPEVKDLLCRHRLGFANLEEVRGKTYKVVTFICAENTIPTGLRESYFVALTRHTDKLIILCPDATFCAS